ncbi:C21orf58 [Bugula neritina]|uniref:C21orf58 n=1 Tax=Bugula neritina TaxID=10212 RepID=A0A7J7JK66_BUGNE|nr:C21orf58 [Bugula neritina]
MMSFDAGGKTTEADDLQAKLLLIGLFISRGLVTTLLMKPLDYGMSSTLLDEIAEQNLRLLASIFVYIVRKVSVPANSKILAMPAEVGKYLYTDAELSSLLDRIKPTIQYADELLRNWIKEYTRRLRAAKIPQ